MDSGGEEMLDYREMYLTMLRASEQAIKILTEAQQQCEEMYVDDSQVTPLPPEEPGAESTSFRG